MSTAAAVQSYEATTLTFGDGERLPCLYAVVDGRSDPAITEFLVASAECRCDHADLDWQAVRRPRSALVGIELTHTCGAPGALRLVFDLRRDADALAAVASTESLVIGTRPYGSFANVMAAFGIDGSAVRQTVQAARAGLDELVSALAG